MNSIINQFISKINSEENEFITRNNALIYNNKITNLFFIVAWIIILSLYLFAFLFTPVNTDAGYYLGITEAMFNGLIPYKDIHLAYTPLSLYLLLIPRMVINSYEMYLGILFIVIFINSFLVYKISSVFITNKKIAHTASITFLLMMFWSDGVYYILEPYVILFGLTAFYFLIKFKETTIKYILIGLFCSFSYLSKQFGIGFIFLILFYIIFNIKIEFKKRILNGLITFIFFLIPILTFYFYFLLQWKINVFDFISGKTYGQKSLLNWATVFIKLIITNASVLFLFLFFFRKQFHQNKILLFTLLIAIFGFSLQFYFASFAHYAIIILPFLVIFSYLIYFNEKRLIIKTIYGLLLFFTIIYTLFRDFKMTEYIYQNKTLRSEQKEISKKIKSITKNNTIYIFDSQAIPFYYLGDLVPYDFKNVGYNLMIPINKDFYKYYDTITSNSDYLLLDMPHFKELSNTDKGISNRQQITINELFMLLKKR